MKKKLLKLILILIVSFVSIDAKEVINSDINKKLPVISLFSFKNPYRAENIVKKLSENYDIYTRFENETYYQFIVNIEPSRKKEVLKDIQTISPNAYFIKKSDFDYGIIFFDKDEQLEEQVVDKVDDEIKVDESIYKESVVSSDIEHDLKKTVEKEFLTIEEKELLESYEVDGFVKVDLIDAVLQTLSRSHKIQASREKMIQASRDIDSAYGNYKPSIDVSYSIARNKRTPGDKDADNNTTDKKLFNDERLSLTINQNIYAGGENAANIEKMKMNYLIAQNNYRGLIEKEITKAVTSYYDIVFRREALAVNQKNIEQLETIFDIVKAKFDSGALSVGELSNVEASIANAMSQLSQTKSRYNNAIEYYLFITGRMFENTYPYQKDLEINIGDFEDLKKESIVNNNKLKGISYIIASKNYSLQMAKSAFRPKVDLQLSAQKIDDQEDYEYDENEYLARMSVKYNLYNGGRDKSSYLKAYSAIRESGYEKEAETREILWNLEKIHTSLISLKESIESVKNEVSSSQSMVDSYWEGFRHGEQDLYVLLQAQRQLNTAELDLIDSQIGRNTSFFKILEVSGKLIEYFGIDIENDNFLDMAHGSYHKRVRELKRLKEKSDKLVASKKSKELEKLEKEPKNEEINQLTDEAIDEEISQEIINEDLKEQDENFGIEDLLSFPEKFLIENPDQFSVIFEDFEDTYKVLEFIKEAKIESKVFIYRTLKNEKIMTHLAYEVFETKEEAEAILELEKFSKVKSKIVTKIGKVQDSWKNFNETAFMKKQEIKPIVVKKEVKQKPFKTDENFKDSFLSANSNYFTINITTFQTIDDAAEVVKSNNIIDNSFVFNYGDDGAFVKLMYGVYETYDEAKKDLENMGKIKSNYLPVIESIGRKQKLYKRYNK